MKTIREIRNDAEKSVCEVGPDRDGFGCVEIRYRDESGKITDRMAFSPAQAVLVGRAISLCAEDLGEKCKVG